MAGQLIVPVEEQILGLDSEFTLERVQTVEQKLKGQQVELSDLSAVKGAAAELEEAAKA